MKKAILKLGYTCNNNCIFCHASEKKGLSDELSLEKIASKVKRAKDAGVEIILFSGGEVTIRPDIVPIMRLMKRFSMPFGFITNARMLSYKRFLNDAIDLGLSYVSLSLHGTEKTHNIITGTSSYHQTMDGIKNLAGSGIQFTVNIVVNSLNIDELDEICVNLINQGATNIRFSNLIIAGNSIRHFEEITPDISIASEKVTHAISRCIGLGARAGYEGFPACLMGDYREMTDDLESNQIMLISESFEDRLEPIDIGDKIRIDECVLCQDKNCQGIEQGYLLRRGKPLLKPTIELIPNSFNMVLKDQFATSQNKGCPICYKAGRYSRQDALLLTDGNIRHFIPDSVDFSDMTIIDIKKKSRLFLNDSGKTLSEDFIKDYLSLSILDNCITCEKRETCCLCFVISGAPSIVEDDRTVRSSLAHIHGDVLDVGCGQIRYSEEFKGPLIRSYIGIEPDRESAIRARELHSLPILEMKIEEYMTCQRFDHILFLRSINHIKRPDQALAKCSGLLKEGGKIIICDSGVFGLLNSKKLKGEIPRTGEQGRIWEHYHNLEYEDVLKLAQGLSLQAISSSQGGTQWMVTLIKK